MLAIAGRVWHHAGVLRAKNTPLYLLQGWPKDTIPKFVEDMSPAAVACDMSPTRVPMSWYVWHMLTLC